MGGIWRRTSDRLFGSPIPAGGPGAGVQLWWRVPPGIVVVGAAVLLEILQPPVSPRRYRWALQAGLVDADGRRFDTAVVTVDDRADASHELAIRANDLGAASLAEPAVWMDLDSPPDETVVVRWSSLVIVSADGSQVPVDTVMVTFPTGRDWRRLDVVTDEVGVLQVANTRRTTANMSILSLPAGR